jgi:hypothetical protein
MQGLQHESVDRAEQLALGATRYSIADQLGCDRTAVQAALRRHSVEVPAPGLDRWELIEALRDAADRAAAARRVGVEATVDARRAMELRVRAEREARRRESPIG